MNRLTSPAALAAILVLAGVFITADSNPNYLEQIYLWLKIGSSIATKFGFVLTLSL